MTASLLLQGAGGKLIITLGNNNRTVHTCARAGWEVPTVGRPSCPCWGGKGRQVWVLDGAAATDVGATSCAHFLSTYCDLLRDPSEVD